MHNVQLIYVARLYGVLTCSLCLAEHAEEEWMSSHNALRFTLVIVRSSWRHHSAQTLEQVRATWRNVLLVAAITDPLRFKGRLVYSPFWSGMHRTCFSQCLCNFCEGYDKKEGFVMPLETSRMSWKLNSVVDFLEPGLVSGITSC